MSHVDGQVSSTGPTDDFAGLISSGTAVPALEALRDEKRRMLAANRATWWALAELDAQAVAQHGAQVVTDLAQDEQCSVAHIKQRLALLTAYGASKHRLAGVNFSVLRAALQAATRTGRAPQDVLDEALAAGWHVADLAQLGRRPSERGVTFDGVCTDCGLEVWVRCKKQGARPMLQGDRLCCPFCSAVVHGTTYLGLLA